MNPLDQLKALHLPEEPGLWPPAPGWWLLGLILLGLVAYFARWLWHRRRANAYRRTALAELEVMISQGDSLPALLTLIRRTAKTANKDSALAAMPGPQLLKELDQFSNGKLSTGNDNDLSSLATVLYNPEAPKLTAGQYQACVEATRLWLRKHRGADLC